MAQGRVSASTAPRQSTFAALKFRNFRLMWISLLVSNSGTWLQSVAQDIIVYEMTGKAVSLGIVNLVRAVALISLSFVGGTIADRVDKRKLLIVTQSCMALTAFTLGLLSWLHMLQIWHIVLISFISAVLLALDQPPRQALIPQLVDREHLMNAIALNSITMTGAAAIGPALAVPVIHLLGAPWGFILNGLSFFAVIFAVWAVKLPPAKPRQQHESVTEAVASGVRYVRATPALMLLLSILTVYAFFAVPYQNVLAVFSYRVFNGPTAFGTLRSAVGWGALAGGFILARVAGYYALDRLVTWGSLAFSALLVVATLVRWLPGSIAVFFLIGTAAQLYSSAIQTLMQQLTNDEMRGRVMSLFAVCNIGMYPLGTYPLSWAADRFGILPALAMAGIIPGIVLLMLWTTRRTVLTTVRA